MGKKVEIRIGGKLNSKGGGETGPSVEKVGSADRGSTLLIWKMWLVDN